MWCNWTLCISQPSQPICLRQCEYIWRERERERESQSAGEREEEREGGGEGEREGDKEKATINDVCTMYMYITCVSSLCVSLLLHTGDRGGRDIVMEGVWTRPIHYSGGGI